MICGETGTGKELFARAIHENSNRKENRLVIVDCAALPVTLVESILFGHEKGAFTGAGNTQEGLVKQAHGGVLFLDEVGELDLATQKSFLRVLESHRFRPVGSKKEEISDFRLIAATNRNLHQMIQIGGFREDLLYRLNTITIDLPPLRERKDTIRELTIHYIASKCDKYGLENKGFAPDFLRCLLAYDWPGNIRELINVIEESITNADSSPTLFHTHLPDKIRVAAKKLEMFCNNDDLLERKGLMFKGKTLSPLREVINQESDRIESNYLIELMSQTGWDIKQACEISGLCRTDLYKYLRKHGITRADYQKTS